MEKKLFKVSITLDAIGFHENIYEFTVLKEGAKTFHIERIDQDKQVTRKFKKKDIIGKIDTGIFYNSISQITYGAWCFKGDIEKFKTKCTEMCTETALIYEKSLNKLLAHLNKLT